MYIYGCPDKTVPIQKFNEVVDWQTTPQTHTGLKICRVTNKLDKNMVNEEKMYKNSRSLCIITKSPEIASFVGTRISTLILIIKTEGERGGGYVIPGHPRRRRQAKRAIKRRSKWTWSEHIYRIIQSLEGPSLRTNDPGSTFSSHKHNASQPHTHTPQNVNLF